MCFIPCGFLQNWTFIYHFRYEKTVSKVKKRINVTYKKTLFFICADSKYLSDSSLFYRCQVIALVNSCQNRFGLFDQFCASVLRRRSRRGQGRSRTTVTRVTQQVLSLVSFHVSTQMALMMIIVIYKYIVSFNVSK